MLMLERIVIESVAKGEKLLETIQADTTMDYSILLSVLSRLVQKGLIRYENGEYNIYKNDIAWKKENSEQKIADEIKELSENLVSNYFSNKEKNSLKLQKIFISEKDEKVLKSLFNNIEVFFENLRKDQRNQKKKASTGRQKVVLWGYSEYKDLIDASLNQAS